MKALILDETRTKFLVVQEQNGEWEFLGGGLERGADPREDVLREIKEETGLEVTTVAAHPSYFLSVQTRAGTWVANVFYEVTLAHLNFTPSDECTTIRFVTPEEARALPARFSNIAKLADLFDTHHI